MTGPTKTNESSTEPGSDEGFQFSETERREFRNWATGYGVEVYGSTPRSRKTALRNEFDDPVIVIEGSKIDNSNNFLQTALEQLGVNTDEKYTEMLSSIDLKNELIETESNIIISDFDVMESELQTTIARLMKGVAGYLMEEDVETMIGYTTEEQGEVVSAERDLNMRIRSWELD